MERDAQYLVLPSRLDATRAKRLVTELTARRGEPIRIVADKVEITSALALEVLISAALQWQVDGKEFAFGPVSGPLRRICELLSLDKVVPFAEPTMREDR